MKYKKDILEDIEEKIEKNIHRYDRQLLIKDWNQEKLKNGIVTIIGSDVLARYIAMPLAALGVGTIRIIDSAKGTANDMLLDLPLKGKSRAQSLEQALKKINPEVNVIGINSDLSTIAAQYFLEGSHVIVDATNDKISKSHVLDYHLKKGVPIISSSADKYNGKVAFSGAGENNLAMLMPMFEGKKQGDFVSLELGGMVAEEVKKLLMRKDEPLNIIYNYNLESNKRFGHISDKEIKVIANAFKDKNILMVGAGALGCLLGPAAISNLSPRRIDVMDYDVVEDHNLNRQVSFYDAVGKLKAERIAETMQKISKGKTQINAIVDKFTEKSKFDTKYDLIFDGVDSFYTKAILHNYAKKHNIPIISGGTDYRAATVLAYKQGETSCFDCQINLSDLAIRAEIIRRTSCIQAPNPSVIMINQIATALMIGEAMCALRPDIYGSPVNGEIKYISDFESRGGVSELESICDCHTKKAKSLELPDKKRVQIKEIEVDGQIIKEVYLDGKRM
ncbi:MAG: ThiF family adenylyltransferase [Nanoarchaeota archaeon]|nr:ThiF family adenylyltransferase [Nanoarchaeota archaeon]MBU1321056.1 ThiF family adenylyltransferase [Nanoarchaeota archaeon]MBU1598125.1 ThiF family adenylyltransferase [Nanoarchaeota archaeon]MBU2442311.1 ThiF family adenylyltransferase [Nanoarchaeota archaeon]